MVTNVTSLLKTVKAVEDEHTRGTRALEATIEAIAQEIRVTIIFLMYQTRFFKQTKFFRPCIQQKASKVALLQKI